MEVKVQVFSQHFYVRRRVTSERPGSTSTDVVSPSSRCGTEGSCPGEHVKGLGVVDSDAGPHPHPLGPYRLGDRDYSPADPLPYVDLCRLLPQEHGDSSPGLEGTCAETDVGMGHHWCPGPLVTRRLVLPARLAEKPESIENLPTVSVTEGDRYAEHGPSESRCAFPSLVKVQSSRPCRNNLGQKKDTFTDVCDPLPLPPGLGLLRLCTNRKGSLRTRVGSGSAVVFEYHSSGARTRPWSNDPSRAVRSPPSGVGPVGRRVRGRRRPSGLMSSLFIHLWEPTPTPRTFDLHHKDPYRTTQLPTQNKRKIPKKYKKFKGKTLHK